VLYQKYLKHWRNDLAREEDLKQSLRSLVGILEPYLVRTIDIERSLQGAVSEGTAQALARLTKAKRLLGE